MNWIRIAIFSALVVSTLIVPGSVAAHHDGSGTYHPIERDEFQRVWDRTDLLVLEMELAGTWIWGPGAHSYVLVEDYDEGDEGVREVQYFDKSRMELPALSAADPEHSDSPWFVTQGLLAWELMLGQLQLGDNGFEDHHPLMRSVAGDPLDHLAPTYAAMGAQIGRSPRAGGGVIVEHIDRDGNISGDPGRFSGYAVVDVEGAYGAVDGIDKAIASVFWDFMNSSRTIYEDGSYRDHLPLFENPFYAVGYPLTDAFWADAVINGTEREVLIQCFERRCLTYAPGNPAGWEVESGNIGQHYYEWRYVEIPIVAEFAVSIDVGGEQEATLSVGESATLNIHLMRNGVAVEGASVSFPPVHPSYAFLMIDPLESTTGADGIVRFTVTGVSSAPEKPPPPPAKFTIDRSPPETGIDVLIPLGSIDITVTERETPGIETQTMRW